MNIYASPGSRVVFAHPVAGYIPHQQTAAEHLTVGETYTVESTDVGSFHTNVFLRERPGVPFNSVMFDDSTSAQDATRKRVALWLDQDGPELKALERIMKKHKLPDRMAALRWLLARKDTP